MSEIVGQSNYVQFFIEPMKYALSHPMIYVNRLSYKILIGRMFMVLQQFHTVLVQKLWILSPTKTKVCFGSTDIAQCFKYIITFRVFINFPVKISVLGVKQKHGNIRILSKGSEKAVPET